MDPGREIEFVLRFSTQSLPDKPIRCLDSWSVLQLKNHIHQCCESNPAVDKQRLIYAGHCLKDDQVLREVFRRCAVDGIRNGKHTSSETKKSKTTSPSSSTIHTSSDLDEVYRQAYHNYLSQCLLQPQPSRSLGQVSVVTRVQHVAPGPGPVPRAGPEDRLDLLDIMYRVVRVAILVALVLYSPLERLLFVVLLICIVLYVQQRRERNNALAQETPAQQPPQPEQGQEANSDDNNNQVPGQEPVGTWTVLWSAVTSFFSSLIPENPAPLNVN